MHDCPGGEDEQEHLCENFQCPGYYRCQGSHTCLHLSHLCDDVNHCQLHDDEIYCHLNCPSECHCQRFELNCRYPFNAYMYPEIRYVDASNSGTAVQIFSTNHYLIHLNLTNCTVKTVPRRLHLPNLQELDLTGNAVKVLDVEAFMVLKNLKSLILSWNPISAFLASHSTKQRHDNLNSLILKGIEMETLSFENLSTFHNVYDIDVSFSKSIEVKSFGIFSHLQHIKMENDEIKVFDADLYKGLKRLRSLQVTNYRLCCFQLLPKHLPSKSCSAKMNELSSCLDLLRTDVYRVFLYLFASFALFGMHILQSFQNKRI